MTQTNVSALSTTAHGVEKIVLWIVFVLVVGAVYGFIAKRAELLHPPNVLRSVVSQARANSVGDVGWLCPADGAHERAWWLFRFATNSYEVCTLISERAHAADEPEIELPSWLVQMAPAWAALPLKFLEADLNPINRSASALKRIVAVLIGLGSGFYVGTWLADTWYSTPLITPAVARVLVDPVVATAIVCHAHRQVGMKLQARCMREDVLRATERLYPNPLWLK